MGKYQRFDEIPAWQEAGRLYQHVLDVVEEPNVPLSATFRNQLERAALCVSNCIAESFGSAAADARVLLGTASGAASEIQSMILIISERPKAARLREPLQQVRVSADSCGRQLAAWKYAIDNPGQKRQVSPAPATTTPASASQPNRPPANNRPGQNQASPGTT
jgi:four helix bundle protein